jgi:hypothetical protein
MASLLAPCSFIAAVSPSNWEEPRLSRHVLYPPVSFFPSIMSAPGDDPGSLAGLQELQSRLSELPPELKRVILGLVVEDDRRLVMKLVSQSSVCKQW